MATLGRWIKRLGAAFALMLLMLGGLLALALGNAPGLSAITGSSIEPARQAAQVRSVFLGTSSLMFTDGTTTWMLDGFLSRPALPQVMFTRLEVNHARVDEAASHAFERLGVSPGLSAVLVAHSHYDHAMDAPYLAQRFGARVIGSPSTRQIALGQNCPDSLIQVFKAGDRIALGDFTVEVIGSAHAPTGYTGGVVSTPLRLPAHALAMKEGGSFAFAVYHRSHGLQPLALIQPSAGFVPGQNAPFKADTVYLGIGGLGKLTEQQVAQYWANVVAAPQAKRVLLIHWDDFTQPLMRDGLETALKPMPYAVDRMDRSLPWLKTLAQTGGQRLDLLQAWQVTQH
ncbi:MAG: MBL fold metallo-hydrolase [Limnobacter sp.]|uniref:MBL fold metallo-hydrolase n=1 Tax=Limnobacter sp. TaxID=2003368 RepID=UPI00391D7923